MPPKRLVLQVAGGDLPPTELPRSGVLTIGCSSDRAGLVLSGDDVADVHCAIGRVKGGGWALKDLGAAVGTLVNGARVQSVRLEPGDEIQIGARRVRVVDPDAAPAPAPPAPAGDASAPEPRRRATARGDSVAPLPSLTGYRVEKELGRGSMGRVYLAVQESLHRPVALKVLPPRLARDRDFVQRFQAEARAAAALNHNNVVTVYDVGEDGGLHFLSMEYMARGSLETRVAEVGRLPWREVLGILIDAARGLEFAEGRGIVHRDIKPANLMQTEDGVTKIADLGLATQLEAEATETMGSKVFGTPHFIAPEQARGEAVDGRTDLYSLGASAFQMLTGRTPFQGDSTREILRAHFFDAPTAVRAEVPEVPDELDRLVGAMLAKDPASRPASAAAVVETLELLRARERAAAPGGGAGHRIALVVVLLALLGGAAAWFLLLGPGAGTDGPDGATVAAGGATHGAAAGSPGGAPGDVPGVGADAAAPGPDGEDGATGPGAPDEPPEDDDRALQLLELEAKLRVSELPTDLGLAARRDELLAIAAEYAGTTEATRIGEEVAALEAQIAAEAGAVDERAAAFGPVLQSLRDAYAAAPDDPRAGLAALMAEPAQDAVVAYPEFVAEREALVGAALADLSAHAQDGLRAARASGAAGDFDAMRAQLEATVAELAPLEWGERADLAEPHAPLLDELAALRREARTRLARVDYERERYLALRGADDAVTLAGELSGANGLEGELARLALTDAHDRLTRLAQALRDDELRAWAADEAAEAARARDALAMLDATLAAGEWRRYSILDPTSSRRATAYDARDVLPEGIRVDDGGSPRVLAWADFARDAKSVEQLFEQRLERDYTPAELAGIAALLRYAAVLEAVERTGTVLRSASYMRFDEEAQEALLAAFDLAAPWAEEAGAAERLERERRAARTLGEALSLAGRDAWSSATAVLEHLLDDASDSLLVRLLSDGTGLAPALPVEPPPPVFEEEPPPEEAPAEEPDDAVDEAATADDGEGASEG